MNNDKFLLFDEKLYSLKSLFFINNSLIVLENNDLLKAYINVIEKFTFASQNNSTNVGDTLSAEDEGVAGHSTTSYGYLSGAYQSPVTALDRIQRWSFSSDGNSTDVGNLTVGRYGTTGTQV